MSDLPLRGELWWCELPDIGRRPVLVMSRNIAIALRRQVVVAACTTTIRSLVSEVVLDPVRDPIRRLTAINLDALESVSVGNLVERIGTLSEERMSEVCDAMNVAVGCHR